MLPVPKPTDKIRKIDDNKMFYSENATDMKFPQGNRFYFSISLHFCKFYKTVDITYMVETMGTLGATTVFGRLAWPTKLQSCWINPSIVESQS